MTIDEQRLSAAQMAVTWQNLAASSAMQARFDYKRRYLKMALHYQRQAQRDHQQVEHYMKLAQS